MLRQFIVLTLLPASVLAQVSEVRNDSLRVKNLNEVEIEEVLSKTNQNYSSVNKPGEAIRQISGADFIRRGNYAYEPVFRGLTMERMNITLDGMRVFGACTDKMDPVTSYVSTNNLSGITAGQSQNASAFGGTSPVGLNLATKKARFTGEPQFTGNGLYGLSFNGLGNVAQGSLDYSSSKFGLRVSGSYRDADPYNDGNGNEVLYTQFHKLNLAANAKYKLSSNEWIEAQFILDDAWDVGYTALPMDVSSAKGRIYSLSYHRYFTNTVQSHLEIKAYGNNIEHVMDDTKRPDVPMHMDMPGGSTTYGGYAHYGQNLGSRHKVKLKADGFYNERWADMIMYPENEKEMFMETWPLSTRVGFGGEAEFSSKWTDKLNTTLLFRSNYYQNTMLSDFGMKQISIFGFDNTDREDLTMGGGLVINHNPTIFNHSLSMKVSQRVPTLSELYGFYLFNAQDGFDYMGNPDLEMENSYQLSYEMKKSFGDVQLSLSPFVHYIENYVFGVWDSSLSVMTIGGNGVKFYENLDYAYITGFEQSAFWQITKNISLKERLKYRYAEDHNGTPLPLIAPLKVDLTAQYKKEKWFFEVSSNIAADQNRVNPIYGEDETSGYVIFNTSAQRIFEVGKNELTVRADLRNLSNRQYWDHLDWGNVPRAGFNGALTVGFKF
jgi:iron complex outermembrane receptor protein